MTLFRWFQQIQEPDSLAPLRAHGMELIEAEQPWGAVYVKQANRLKGFHVKHPRALDAALRAWNRQVRWGYLGPREDVLSAACSAVGRTDATTWALLQSVLEIALHQKADEEARWHDPTTNDRLDAAWDGLEQLGITVWSCLGEDESDAIRRLQSGDLPLDGAEGVVFFSESEVERAVRGEGLEIRCSGLAQPGPHLVPDVAVGQTVSRVLELAGVPASWSGRPYDPLRVAPFKWRKRLHGSAGTFPPPVNRGDSAH